MPIKWSDDRKTVWIWGFGDELGQWDPEPEIYHPHPPDFPSVGVRGLDFTLEKIPKKCAYWVNKKLVGCGDTWRGWHFKYGPPPGADSLLKVTQDPDDGDIVCTPCNACLDETARRKKQWLERDRQRPALVVAKPITERQEKLL